MWNFSRFSRYTDLALALALTAGGIYFFSGYFTPVRFDRERIEVRIENGGIRVSGLYRYSNSSWLPSVLTLRVPFPVDRDHREPEWFVLFESDERGHAIAEIVPVVRGGKVSFRQIFRPLETRWVRLDYAQQTRVGSGRYLLTTTRAWGRPITQADFVLRLTSTLELKSSSYPVQGGTASENGKSYSFSRTGFYPDTDWVFSWGEESAQTTSSARRQP